MGAQLPLPSAWRIDYDTRLAARQVYDAWEQQAQQFQNALPQQQLGNYQQALGMVQGGCIPSDQLGCGCRACQLDYPYHLDDPYDRYLLANMSEEEFLLMRRGRPGPRLGTRFGATERAEKTLNRFLTPEQQHDLLAFGFFDVTGKGKVAGKLGFRKTQTRKFRIYSQGPSVNELKSNGLYQHLCIMSLTPVPRADIMLSWKLLIEADLERFLKTANRIGPPHP